jgi:serine/threonine protein kinase
VILKEREIVCDRVFINIDQTFREHKMMKGARPIPIKTNTAPAVASPYPSPVSPTGMAFSPSQCIANYSLSCEFLAKYKLGIELGFGGFGFVYSATRLSDGTEVACKFIFKSKIVRSSWTYDKDLGRCPMEVAVLKNVDQ